MSAQREHTLDLATELTANVFEVNDEALEHLIDALCIVSDTQDDNDNGYQLLRLLSKTISCIRSIQDYGKRRTPELEGVEAYPSTPQAH